MNAGNDEHKPLVAVILVAYGGRDDTIACIESLRKSDYKKIKIILVDNASPDDTRKIVSERFSDVEIIANEKNLGFAGGNNVGIKRARDLKADYIFLLNNDTEIDPLAIDHLVETAEKTENIGCIGPMIYYYSEKNQIWSAGGIIDFRFSFLKHRGIREIDNGQYDKTVDVDYLTGCALMFPSSLVDTVGMLDESFWMYYEDADFCMRVRQKGMRIIFEPRAKISHKISSSTGGNLALKKIRYKFQSGWQFFSRYSKSPFWFITYPLSQIYLFLLALGTRR